MKIRFIVLAATVFSTLLASGWSVSATAGPRVGNGGGAWICKDKTSQVNRWMRLIDLFEAQVEFHRTLQVASGLTYLQLVDQKVAEIQSGIPELQAILTRSPDQIKSVLQMVSGSAELTRIDDGHIEVHPQPESCENGYIFYGQLANYTDDGRLLVDENLWASLTFGEIDRAALLIHEVIYKSLRDSRAETNSWRTRQLVGILFSNMNLQAKNSAVHEVLSIPAPSGDTSQVILDPFELSCRAAVTSADGAYTWYDFQKLSPLEAASTTLADYTFKVEMNLSSGMPSELLIIDNLLHAQTSLGHDGLQAVLTSKHEVGITLENQQNQKSAYLSCHIQIYPQN